MSEQAPAPIRVTPTVRHRPVVISPQDAEIPPEPADVDAALAPVLEALGGRRVAVLTGAGISTDSGIPDYRSPGSPVRRPITQQEFLTSARARQHYWARNHLGWRHLASAEPNPGHRALADLETAGVVTGVVTQNIDMLHDRAGSRNVIHLHGRYDRVLCLDRGHTLTRSELDDVLTTLNPGWRERHSAGEDVEIAPDADAALARTDDFRIAPCPVCGGMLQPDVVFFGAITPPARVAAATTLLETSEALLVAGSSLAVMSGLRFARRAVSAGKPVVVVNRGPSRADDLAVARANVSTSRALPWLAERLGRPAGH